MPILVVDDQVNSRDNVADWVVNTFGNDQAIRQVDPLQSVDALLERVRRDGIDAVTLDYKMARNYSPVDGMELAIRLFDAKIPSVIVSSYVESGLPKYFWRGAKIPAILARSELSSGLAGAVERARARIQGRHSPQTLPSRTLVRILSIDENEVGLLIPAYRATDGKLVEREELRARLPNVDLQVGLRMMAQVNLGAPNLDQLFVTDLELAPDLDDAHARLLRR